LEALAGVDRGWSSVEFVAAVDGTGLLWRSWMKVTEDGRLWSSWLKLTGGWLPVKVWTGQLPSTSAKYFDRSHDPV
jgi:hypothetical protein